jgi:hypothetical protein
MSDEGGLELAVLRRYPELNLVMDLDVYPLTKMQDFAAKAAICTALSKIRLQKGYHQIPVNPEDVQKPAFTTPFGLFTYKRMPFGLINAGTSFQHHVDRAIWYCKAAIAWVNDIIICSRNHEEMWSTWVRSCRPYRTLVL